MDAGITRARRLHIHVQRRRGLAIVGLSVGLDTHPNIDATTGLGELLRLPFAPHQVASGRDGPIPVAAIA